MTTIRHILIPTDGSEVSAKSAKFGGDLARAINARVTLLTVLNEQAVVPAAWHGLGIAGPGVASAAIVDTVREEFERNAVENELPEAAAAVGDLPVAAKQVHVWGHAASEICDYALENDVDLIVIGSHGRTGIKAVLLGSVSHAVVNRAPCAVTIVR